MKPLEKFDRPTTRDLYDAMYEVNVDLNRQISDVKNEILSTKESVLDTREDIVDVKTDILNLRTHVNHRSELLENALTLKADQSQLLTSIAFRLLAKPAARWALGFVAGSTFLTIGRSHWLPWIESLLGSF